VTENRRKEREPKTSSATKDKRKREEKRETTQRAYVHSVPTLRTFENERERKKDRERH
jgi:hypothetical protein